MTPKWLEDPYAMTVLAEGIDVPDATVVAYVAQAGPRAEHIEVMPRDDARYLEAVDASFVQLCRTVDPTKWTPLLLDRAKGYIKVAPTTDGGRTRHLCARVVFIIDPENRDESGDPAKRPAKGTTA